MVDDGVPPARQSVSLHRVRTDVVELATELHMVQQQRRARRDIRLPQLTERAIRSEVERLVADHDLVIFAAGDTTYACGFPDVEVYQQEDDGLAYFQRVCGVVRGLALRDDSNASRAAITELLGSAIPSWRSAGATGGKVAWPVFDFDITPELGSLGILPDAYLRYRIREAGPMPGPAPAQDVYVRSARHDDIDSAAALNAMVLDEHIWVSPFARRVSGVEDRFRNRFMAASDGYQDGRGLFFVAEVDGNVVAMAECEIEEHRFGLDSTLRSGAVGYIHVFGVDKSMRRRRIGTSLARFALDELAAKGASAVRLIVSHYNAPSRTFWRLMGFDDVWRLYQTHRLTDG